MKLIIVDDEKRIRTSLRNVLQLHYPKAAVVAEAADIAEAAVAIKQYGPDVVLLDIKMPGGTGFDLLRDMFPCTFKVIFITAFDQYALQAFRFSAVDYLLKPVVPADLIRALDRAAMQLDAEQSNEKLQALLNNMNMMGNDSKRIVLNSQEKMTIVSVSEIIRCEADRNYTMFFLADQRRVVVSKPLKEYDDLLTPFNFFRCHHSHLVNLGAIRQFDKRDGGSLIMKDGSEVPVSSRKSSELMGILNRL